METASIDTKRGSYLPVYISTFYSFFFIYQLLFVLVFMLFAYLICLFIYFLVCCLLFICYSSLVYSIALSFSFSLSFYVSFCNNYFVLFQGMNPVNLPKERDQIHCWNSSLLWTKGELTTLVLQLTLRSMTWGRIPFFFFLLSDWSFFVFLSVDLFLSWHFFWGIQEKLFDLNLN